MRQYLVEHVGMSEAEAKSTCDLKACEEDKERAIELVRSMGITDENIRVYTDTTTEEDGI